MKKSIVYLCFCIILFQHAQCQGWGTELFNKHKIYYNVNEALANSSHVYILQIQPKSADIVEIPNDISKLTNLKRLEILGAVYELPESLSELDSLLYLELDLNNDSNLEQVFRVLSKLTHLECLKIKGEIHCLPKGIKGFKSLVKLSLTGMKVKGLPYSDLVSHLKNLEIIQCYYLDVDSVLMSIDKISSLQNLVLIDCNIEKFPFHQNILNQINSLDLSCNNLTRLPETIVGYKNLAFLYLNSNHIKKKEIPKNGYHILEDRIPKLTIDLHYNPQRGRFKHPICPH